MKLVERLTVKWRYYDVDSSKHKIDTVCVAASETLFESDDLLEIGSYLNEELRLDCDCNRLLKTRSVLEDSDHCVVYNKQLSDSYPLSNNIGSYSFNREYSIEK